MIIRAKIASLLARPFLFPIAVASFGLWYGTFSIASKILQIIYVDTSKLNKNTKFTGNVLGTLAGAGIIFGSGILKSDGNIPELKKADGVSGVAKYMAATAKNVPIKKVTTALVASALAASTVASVVHKNL